MKSTITKQELYNIVRKDENSKVWVEQEKLNEDGVIYSGLMVKEIKVGDLEITLQEYFDLTQGLGPWACDANIDPVIVEKNGRSVMIVDDEGDETYCNFDDIGFSFDYEKLFGLFHADISSDMLSNEDGCVHFEDGETLVEDWDFPPEVVDQISKWKKANEATSILNLGENLYRGTCEVSGRTGRTQRVLCTTGKRPPLEFEEQAK